MTEISFTVGFSLNASFEWQLGVFLRPIAHYMFSLNGSYLNDNCLLRPIAHSMLSLNVSFEWQLTVFKAHCTRHVKQSTPPYSVTCWPACRLNASFEWQLTVFKAHCTRHVKQSTPPYSVTCWPACRLNASFEWQVTVFNAHHTLGVKQSTPPYSSGISVTCWPACWSCDALQITANQIKIIFCFFSFFFFFLLFFGGGGGGGVPDVFVPMSPTLCLTGHAWLNGRIACKSQLQRDSHRYHLTCWLACNSF